MIDSYVLYIVVRAIQKKNIRLVRRRYIAPQENYLWSDLVALSPLTNMRVCEFSLENQNFVIAIVSLYNPSFLHSNIMYLYTVQSVHYTLYSL